MEVFLLLGIPLAGGLVLALVGQRDAAPEINVGFSFAASWRPARSRCG